MIIQCTDSPEMQGKAKQDRGQKPGAHHYLVLRKAITMSCTQYSQRMSGQLPKKRVRDLQGKLKSELALHELLIRRLKQRAPERTAME